jgi:hypothetical protein
MARCTAAAVGLVLLIGSGRSAEGMFIADVTGGAVRLNDHVPNLSTAFSNALDLWSFYEFQGVAGELYTIHDPS